MLDEKIPDRASYIIKDMQTDKVFQVLADSVNHGYKGLCITRNHPEEVNKQYGLDVSLLWLTNQKSDDFSTCSTVADLKLKIRQFIKKNSKSVVLMDRIDYLINMHGFNEFLRLVYAVNDEVVMNNAILMLNVNPNVLSSTEVALLEQELKMLPRFGSEPESELSDDLYEILTFVNYNEKVTFKKVSKEFSITKTTTRKRVNKVEELGLIKVNKNGRNKVIRMTDKGRSLL